MASNKTAIIGAGFGGLALALALHARDIPCDVYELRAESYEHGGGVMLSPNAIRVLDHIGAWEAAKSKGYRFETMAFLTDDQEVTGYYTFGNEKLFGYPGIRIYRSDMIKVFRALAKERSIPIH